MDRSPEVSASSRAVGPPEAVDDDDPPALVMATDRGIGGCCGDGIASVSDDGWATSTILRARCDDDADGAGAGGAMGERGRRWAAKLIGGGKSTSASATCPSDAERPSAGRAVPRADTGAVAEGAAKASALPGLYMCGNERSDTRTPCSSHAASQSGWTQNFLSLAIDLKLANVSLSFSDRWIMCVVSSV